MFKNVIAPIQAWLLSQGQCVGCGSMLSKAQSKDYKNNTKMITCKCKRMYVFDIKTKKYRRALLSEI